MKLRSGGSVLARSLHVLAMLGCGSLLTACQPSIPEGVFACTTDAECPSGMYCAQGSWRCFRTAAQVPPQAESNAGSTAITTGAPVSGAPAAIVGSAGNTQPAVPNVNAGSAAGTAGAGAIPISGTGGGSDTPPPASSMCTSGELLCDALCVPNDAQHCGSCGHNCTTLAHVIGPVTCADGSCNFAPTSCAPGWANCSNNPETGCETNITVPEHCGACDVQCSGATPVCSAGSCTSGCPSDAPSLCDGACVDNQTSPNHCGQCGHACTTSVEHAEPTCEHGGCGFACNTGYENCSGACVDTNTDPGNCGGCGRTCGSSMLCQAGACVCSSGYHDCGGTCLKDDDVNSCGTSCSPCRTSVAHSSATCLQGSCGFKCDGSYTMCSSACVDTRTDPANCGTCGKSCRGGQNCTAGLCVCPLGTHDCGGTCVSNTSVSSCGLFACNSPCPGPITGYGVATCDGLSCGIRCTTGELCSSNSCIDTDSDSNNCGRCGNMCTGGKTCQSGRCDCPSGTHECDSRGCVSNTSVDSCGTSCTRCEDPVNDVGTPICNAVTLKCEVFCPGQLNWCNRGCYEFCAI